MRMVQRLRLGNRDGIVAVHVDLGTEDQKRLDEVVREGIVVIDQQQFRCAHAL
jgi:hypothetical protein